MDIEKDANLGSGNIIQEFNINTVHHLYPNAQTVINNIGSGNEKAIDNSKAEKPKSKKLMEECEISSIRAQIKHYVNCLIGQVVGSWISHYDKLWDGILDLPVVAAKVYDRGKQQNTNFNRNLVANIIHFLGNGKEKENRIYKDYSAALFTEKLEADKEHSVRAALGQDPPEEITYHLVAFLETFQL